MRKENIGPLTSVENQGFLPPSQGHTSIHSQSTVKVFQFCFVINTEEISNHFYLRLEPLTKQD